MSSKPRPPTQYIGARFGMLEVKALVHTKLSGRGRWTYKASVLCDCGNNKSGILLSALRAGRITSCGCMRSQYMKITGSNNAMFKGHRDIRFKFWSGYQLGAVKRGIHFDITIKYAWRLFERQGRRCALSGVPLVFGIITKNSNTTASLDRINNSKGYVRGNVQWVHKRINLMRNILSVDEFIDFCRKVTKHAALRER